MTPPDAARCGRRAADASVFPEKEAMGVANAHTVTAVPASSKPPPPMDAAAKALDKLFDFSEWGEQM